MNMPPMIYGTAWKREKTKTLVIHALQNGFLGIDTACQPKHYREDLVGEGIMASGVDRDRLFIQTKFTPLAGQDPSTIPYDQDLPLSKQVADSFSVSQKNLQIDVIDSYLLHSTMMPLNPLMQIWRAMEAIVDDGGARQIGVCNCYDITLLRRLYDDARIKPTILQNRFYDESGYDTDIRAFCDEKGIRYQSFWTLTANPHILSSRTIQTLAKKYAWTEAQIFYRYLILSGIVPLNGTTSSIHMDEDLNIFDVTFAQDEMQSITDLLR